jgi:two-component system chemotaxis response regulator CheB
VLADLVEYNSDARVREPAEDDQIDCATIYVGRASERVEVDSDGTFEVDIDCSGAARISRIDDLFCSIASAAGENAVGIILSGMLRDGVAGLEAIRKAGGVCIVQDPGDASFRSMPDNALAAVDVDFLGDSPSIVKRLNEIMSDRECI